MIRAIHLHGALGSEFGSRFDLAVASPAEAIRALRALLPGFREAVERGAWRLVRGPLVARPCGLGDVSLGFGSHEREMHLLPALEGGADGKGFVGILVGAALIGASFFIPPAAGVALGFAQGAVASAVFGMGLSLALSGVSTLLAPAPRGPSERARRLQSDLFQAPGVTAEPGTPVPVNFGRFRAGGVLVSLGLYVEDAA